VGLAIANLEQAVFEIMGGNRGAPTPASPADDAYAIVVLLALLSWISSPALLIGYVVAIVRRAGEKK
jgi:hypothetical protein